MSADSKPILCIDMNCNIENDLAPGFFEWVERMRDKFKLQFYSPLFKTEEGTISFGLWLHAQRNKWIKAGGQRHPTETLEIEFVGEMPDNGMVVNYNGLITTDLIRSLAPSSG